MVWLIHALTCPNHTNRCRISRKHCQDAATDVSTDLGGSGRGFCLSWAADAPLGVSCSDSVCIVCKRPKSVLGQTELCTRACNARHQKTHIIRNHINHLTLSQSLKTKRCEQMWTDANISLYPIIQLHHSPFAIPLYRQGKFLA